MLRIAVCISGNGTNLQAIIDQLPYKLKDVSICVVISNQETAYGLVRAAKYQIPTEVISRKKFKGIDDFDNRLLEIFHQYKVDLIVLAGFMVVLSNRIISQYPNQIINIHPSLIPAFSGTGYYGIRVHEAVLLRGVKVTGATVHYVDAGTDTGPILLQKPVYVHSNDTPLTLQERVMKEAEWELLPEAIYHIAKNRRKLEQEERKFK